jgi:hypothetical protein
MLNESINGIATIRANHAVDYMKLKFESIHNAHSRAFFAFVASSRWVGFRMDSLMFITVSASCILTSIFSANGKKFYVSYHALFGILFLKYVVLTTNIFNKSLNQKVGLKLILSFLALR